MPYAACSTDKATARKILEHLGLGAELARAAARRFDDADAPGPPE
jgi:hypothetical protein